MTSYKNVEEIYVQEAKETDSNDELSLIENEIISDFETPEEYLLYYARVGDDGKLRKLFDLLEKENTIININAKGNSKSNRGWSALHLSIYFGHFLVSSLLIEKKADVNITNNDGDTPLHKAAYIGRMDLVTLLLANKADVFIKNENLKLAKHVTRDQAVLALLEEVEESDLKKREIEFLNCAKNGDIARMKELLNNENPVDINCVDDQGDSALHKAAFRNQKDVITFLLQQNDIDTTIKNRRQQIAASLSQNISIKQLLLNVKPNFKNKPKGKLMVNRFESTLMRRNRIRVWRQIYCVLEKGIISFYGNRADGTSGTRRRDYYYLDGAIVEANNDNLLAFTIFFNSKSKVQLQVVSAANVSSKELAINRQRWINAIKEHIEYSKNFLRQGFSVDDDSDEDLNDLLPTSYLENLIKNSQAHQAILNRHINGLAQFIDEDLKTMQSELGLESIELSNNLMNLLKRFWPGLTFHLNLIKESAANTSGTLQTCLSLMDKQDKLRQLQLKESQDKVRVLEEIIQALAQQQYDFEKSISAPYKSPPRKKEADHDLESQTDCEEYFDAFDEDDDSEKSCSSKSLDKHEEATRIKESEEFQILHDLQQVAIERLVRKESE